MVEIGNSYNGICTSYGKCVHGIENELLLHRATATRMTNQMEFIINHIASQPNYIKNTGLFEAFQENQAKWAEVEAGIYDKYIRGEGTLSPVTQNLTWDREHLRYEERQYNDQHDIDSTQSLMKHQCRIQLTYHGIWHPIPTPPTTNDPQTITPTTHSLPYQC